MFFRIHAFQGPVFLGSRFFSVQVFQGTSFSGSGLGVRVQVQLFLTTNINLLFRSRNYFKSFQCKTGYGWQRAVDFNMTLVFKTSQKNSHHYRRPFNATLISPNNNVQVQPLENLLNNFFFRFMPNRIFWILSPEAVARRYSVQNVF